MTYTPNFNDPRVKKKLTKALNYSLACVSTTKPRPWATRQIDVWFGQSQHSLSKWLREELLITDSDYYNAYTGKCKKYTLNHEGVVNIRNKLGLETPSNIHGIKIEAADNIYGDEIAAGAFEYKNKSDRLWHDMQNLSNDIRKPLFANYGYIHEYDIKSCAPTIIAQLASTTGMQSSRTPAVNEYLKNPELHRQRLADLLCVDRKTAKKLITARFAGATLRPQSSLFYELGSNYNQFNKLKNDEWFAYSLQKDIKKQWDAIKQLRDLPKLTPRVKWGVYFKEELKVMKCVHRYLDKSNTRYFHEHDGWRSNTSVDLRELKLHLIKQTGYDLNFDYDVFVK